MEKLSIVIMISGHGSNLQAIMDSCQHLVNIKCVISDQPDAYGLRRAREAGIPTHCVVDEETNRTEFCEQIINIIKPTNPDLVVLAGFMKMLTPNFIEAFPRTVNIHPSLLPCHPGLHTHRRVLADGDKKHGVTIHWINEELDAGPTIWQKSFVVEPDDTETTLTNKVQALEHKLYPWVINKIAGGSI